LPDFTTLIIEQHESLFASGASRGRLLNAAYQEAGIGQQADNFEDGGQTYIASMVTQDFIGSGAKVFITGVIYTDTDDDDFYDVGEGIAARKVSAKGAVADKSGAGGGYELQFAATGIKTVTFKVAGEALTLDVALGASNVKVDLVNGSEIWTNGSVQSTSLAIRELHALGVSPLVLIGGAAGETIVGNKAANQLLGLGGRDVISSGAGKDTIVGGGGSDTLAGGAGADVFLYTKRKDSPATAPDAITGFGDGDRIDLGALAEEELNYRGEADSTSAGQVRVSQDDDDVIVHINLDAEADDEVQIVLSGIDVGAMSKDDFIL
jgi:Ca2+-binding RTX toxin-like protein